MGSILILLGSVVRLVILVEILHLILVILFFILLLIIIILILALNLYSRERPLLLILSLFFQILITYSWTHCTKCGILNIQELRSCWYRNTVHLLYAPCNLCL